MLTGLTTCPVEGLFFLDAWGGAGGEGPGYTWDHVNPYASARFEPNRRIDYILVGEPKARGAGHVVECRVAGNQPVDGVWPSGQSEERDPRMECGSCRTPLLKAPADPIKRRGDERQGEQSLAVGQSRHDQPEGRGGGESEAAEQGQIADRGDDAVAVPPGLIEPAADQGGGDGAMAIGRVDRQGSEQKRLRGAADHHRPETQSPAQPAAVPRHEAETGNRVGAPAQPVGRPRQAIASEGAVEQVFDGGVVGGVLGCNIDHGWSPEQA